MFRSFLYIVVFLTGATNSAHAEQHKICPENISELAKTMLNCVVSEEKSIKKEETPRTKKVTTPVAKPIERTDIHDFLLRLAREIVKISPPPFDRYPAEKLLVKHRKRDSFDLIIPLSHHHRSEMKARDVSDRLLLTLNQIKTSPLFAKRKVIIQVHTDFVSVTEKSSDPNCKPFRHNLDVSRCRAFYLRKLLRKNNLNTFQIVPKGDRQSRCRKVFRSSCDSNDIAFERQLRIVVNAS